MVVKNLLTYTSKAGNIWLLDANDTSKRTAKKARWGYSLYRKIDKLHLPTNKLLPDTKGELISIREMPLYEQAIIEAIEKKEGNGIGKVERAIKLKGTTLTRKNVPNDLPALTGYKYTDTDTEVSRHGKLVTFWKQKGFKEITKGLRKPALHLKENFFSTEPYDTLVNYYQWKGIEFGNWTTNEDRFNYLVALVLCSHDLNLILKFNNNVGLWHTIHIAFGARGQGKALAHFEPLSFAINLTRYKRADKADGDKETRFEKTGGVGSFAHEYGHALDYFYGQYVEKARGISLSEGDGTSTTFTTDQITGNTLHAQMNRIIMTCIWKKGNNPANGIWTDYYKRLKEKFHRNEYWFRHNEIWARLFEQYIQYKLQKKHIQNVYLAKRKYEDSRYLPASEFKKVVPLIDKLIASMAATAKRPIR